MRSWLTTHEVRALLGVSRPRVSQLVKSGDLVADRDAEGRLQYDRRSAEQYAAERAARMAPDRAAAEERRAIQAEARERLARERRRHAQEIATRRARYESWAERVVLALEKIASRPCK